MNTQTLTPPSYLTLQLPSQTSELRESACFAVAVEIDCTIVGKQPRAHGDFRVNPLDDKLRRQP